MVVDGDLADMYAALDMGGYDLSPAQKEQVIDMVIDE